MKRLSDDLLTKIEQRAEKATKEPWQLADTNDAQFIYKAREDVPKLVAALREAYSEIDRLEAVYGRRIDYTVRGEEFADE